MVSTRGLSPAPAFAGLCRFALKCALVAFVLSLAGPRLVRAQTLTPATAVRMIPANEMAPTPTVTVLPATATVMRGTTQRFTATVTGTANRQVTWTASGGTITSDGTFSAPGLGAYRVIATITGGTIAGAADVQSVGPPIIGISPGQDILSVIAATPSGTSFLLKAGVHRLQTIRPRDGDTYTGEPGTVMSGARLLTAFTRSGSYWVASGQTQQGIRHGLCLPGYPRCSFPEQLFIDDQVLLHVGTLAEVAAGSWYFDYGAGRIYFADDPTGHRVETSVTTTAFEATGNNVTITGVTVEKYANLAQNGAITTDATRGWVISGNDVRWNHGLGIRSGTSARVLGNKVHHNGQMGIGGGGTDVLVEGNEIAYNNTAHFDAGWEAGGTKFALTIRLTARGNNVHHNSGPGLWTDVDNINTVYENNTVEDNDGIGIFHEISYDAIIRNNIVRRNGLGYSDWIWGAGILVAASPNVEIYGNTLEGNADGVGAAQQDRGSGAYGPHEISNLYVHDNIIRMTQGWTGLVEDIGDQSYFTSRNNRFDRNSYDLPSGAAFHAWMDGERSVAEWKGYGQDVNGTFSVVAK